MLSRNKLQPVDIPPQHFLSGWRHHHNRNVKIQLFDELRSTEVQAREDEHLVVRCFKRFADVTSLHGFKYLSEPNRPFYERIFWLVALVAVYALAVMTVAEQIHNYEISPVLVSIDTDQTYVHHIPFPSVTICPVNRLKIVIPAATTANDSITEEEMDLSEAICGKVNRDRAVRKVISQEAARRTLQRVFTYKECRRLVAGIAWQNKIYTDPCRLLQPTVNLVGFCFTFNLLPLQKIFRNTTFYYNMSSLEASQLEEVTWSLDQGYSAGYPSTRIPWRVAGSGIENGLSIVLRMPLANYSCLDVDSEMTAIVHGPHDLPTLSHIMVPIYSNKVTVAQVKPRVVNTSELLNYWSPEQRGCYFETERRLMHFTRYSQNNCDLECEANKTLSLCGCSPLHHPRRTGTPVCGTKKTECVHKSVLREGNVKDRTDTFCNCLPSCNELDYEVHTTSYKRDWPKYLRNFFLHTQPVEEILSDSSAELGGISIFFLSKFTVPVRRNSLLSGIHFIGNIGGLLGLFLGFSILSLVEIVYFLFFRPCYRLYQSCEQKKHNTASA